MTQETRELLERALRLPAEDRALLAGAIDASLAEGDDAGPRVPPASAAWREEIARRLREYREGTVSPVPAEQVHADALAAIERARTLRGGSPSA